MSAQKLPRLLEPESVREWMYVGSLKNGDELYQHYENTHIYKIRTHASKQDEYYTLVGIEYP